MREVIRWVCLRSVDPGALKHNTSKILDAAEQFLLPSLAREAERELTDQICPENILSIVERADRYNVSLIIVQILVKHTFADDSFEEYLPKLHFR